MIKRLTWVLASATAVLACSGAATTTSESSGEPQQSHQADVSKTARATAPVNATRASDALQSGMNLPPVVSEKPPVQTAFLDRCPIEKVDRADFKELSRAKAEHKAQLLSAPAPDHASPAKQQAPDARLLSTQESFLAAAQKKRKSFDAMTLEAREKAYGELKASFFGDKE